MQIAGIQKTTLIDYPGKVASTLFTLGCNMKCPYCHNKQISFDFADTTTPMDINEVFDFFDERKDFIDAISLSGGEPTLQPDLLDFCKIIKKKYNLLIKLDTNGSFPDVIKNAVDQRLVDYIALDIKTSFSRYKEYLGVDGELIYRTYKIISSSNIGYELRMTCFPDFIDSESVAELLPMLNVKDRIFLQQCYLNKSLGDPVYDVPTYDKTQLELFENIMNSKGFSSASIRNKL